MYIDAGHIVDTIIHVLNAEQEFFRDFVRAYEPEKANKEQPLSVRKGFFDNRGREELPLIEVAPASQDVEYITGWTRHIATVLNDPRRLQAAIIDADNRRQYRWTLGNNLIQASFLDSLLQDISYSESTGGTLHTANMSWWCKVHTSYPAEAFKGHWPHYTEPNLGPPFTGIEGIG